MKGFVFPGQGTQFPGMGKDLYESSTIAKEIFLHANSILKYNITDIMFGEDAEALKATEVTQPAIFIHSVILAKVLADKFNPNFVGGHSLGEFSALVAAEYIDFEDGLNLVKKRADAMQKACIKNPSTMAAIIGLENNIVEDICDQINKIVVPANYNCPGQLVISGSFEGVDIACEKLIEAGARRALKLQVGGAFHSPLMEPAKKELEKAINETNIKKGLCPIFQNVTATSTTSPDLIQENLIKQLTSPVKWTHIMQNMIKAGLTEIIEVGPGKVIQGLFRKIDRNITTSSASL
ncbi:MAG: ACP S-malonyltransferase [Flavobacteriales bacterium]|jgi:[acyl-carrier-protein] S-malonyltransferase|nr:ACP S-malonyltransferase [Flavobacteriales bacterium]